MLVMNGFQKNNLLLVKKIVRYLPKIITVNYKNNQVLYKQLKKFQIPIPSLEKQARIVAILDKFDALTNSITEGLPREIELRTKQYEYYRDLLLNFPKNEVVK